MDKIYKIYFDGERVVNKVQYHYYIEGEALRFIFEEENTYNITSSIQENDMNKVLEYSLGDIVAYTFNENNVERLSALVEEGVKNYHEEQIFRKEKAIREHEEILYKLHFRMSYE